MDRTIDEMIDFFLFEKGEEIKINGVSQRAMLLDAHDKISRDADQLIYCKVEIKTGDIIECGDKKYIITSQIIQNNNFYYARLKQCPYSIAFNFAGSVIWFPTFIETKVMDIETNQYMSLATGTIIITIQENINSKEIKLKQRLIHTGRAWEVTGIDRSVLGLMKLYCDLTGICSDDDLINEIADAEYPYVAAQVNVESSKETADGYSITVSGYPEIKIGGSIRTYAATVYMNGAIMTDKSVIWSIQNEDGSTTTKAMISSSTSTTCKVVAVDKEDNIGEKLILKVVLAENSKVCCEYTIKIISLT